MSNTPHMQPAGGTRSGAGQNGDALSEILRFMGLRGRLFCRATLRAPWSLAIPADRLAHFHFVERGVCRLRLQGQKVDRLLSAGEIAILPHGSGHWLYDKPNQASAPIRQVVGTSSAGHACALVQHGGTGEETRMLCGSFSFRPDREALVLPLLPPVLVMFAPGSDPSDPLGAALRLMMVEATTQQPGSALVLSRMVETLFVHVLRFWLATSGQPTGHMGNWLLALRNERAGRALNAIHARPDHPWTVAELAALAGASRSAFAALFAKATGAAPLAYLKRWRINLSAGYLEEGRSLKEAAEKVGYASAASYAKAFRAVMGVAPGDWRRQHATEQQIAGAGPEPTDRGGAGRPSRQRRAAGAIEGR